MDFPIISLLDEDRAQAWVLKHFHPQGLGCPECEAGVAEAPPFPEDPNKRSTSLPVLRGICQGISSAQLARELGISRQTVLSLRRKLQAAAEAIQPQEALPDAAVETDEMFQNAGEKGEPHRDASDPPRRRGNKRKGHGTYENDRPPIVGTKGRESGLLRLRLVHQTDSLTLSAHVHSFTLPKPPCIQMGGVGITALTAPV